jgi:hypothetical protein
MVNKDGRYGPRFPIWGGDIAFLDWVLMGEELGLARMSAVYLRIFVGIPSGPTALFSFKFRVPVLVPHRFWSWLVFRCLHLLLVVETGGPAWSGSWVNTIRIFCREGSTFRRADPEIWFGCLTMCWPKVSTHARRCGGSGSSPGKF